MAKPNSGKPSAAKTKVKLGQDVFYFLTPEEQRANQGSRVLPAKVVNVGEEDVRITIFGDSDTNPWKTAKLRTDESQTGVYDTVSGVPEV